jgi:hypothetical protein
VVWSSLVQPFTCLSFLAQKRCSCLHASLTCWHFIAMCLGWYDKTCWCSVDTGFDQILNNHIIKRNSNVSIISHHVILLLSQNISASATSRPNRLTVLHSARLCLYSIKLNLLLTKSLLISLVCTYYNLFWSIICILYFSEYEQHFWPPLEMANCKPCVA